MPLRENRLAVLNASPSVRSLPVPVRPVPTNPGIQQTAAPIASENQYHVINSGGQAYGPVTQSQLEGWVAEGRVNASDMIQQVGTQFQMAASQMFPSLLNVQSQMEASYGTPAMQRTAQTARVNRVSSKSNFRVTAPSFDVIWRNTMNAFQQHWLILVAAAFIMGVPLGIINAISNIVVDGLMDQSLVAGLLANLGFWAISSVVSIYFGCGFATICLNILRGQNVDLGTLFSGRAFGTTLLCMIPIWIGTVLPPVIAAVISFAIEIDPPVALFTTSAVALFSNIVAGLLWPVMYLAVDGKAEFPGIYSTALQITVTNLGTCMILLILIPVILILGLLAFCIGIIPAGAFVAMLFPAAYMAMTNQIK